VRPGDHVAVHNPIKRVAFTTEGGYRQAARQIFAVEGTPCIEVLARARAANEPDQPRSCPAKHARQDVFFPAPARTR
jgi:hypothetical protein